MADEKPAQRGRLAGQVEQSPEVAEAAANQRQSLATNPGGVSMVPVGVQLLPAELDDDQETPAHRADLQEAVGARANVETGEVGGTQLERIDPDELADGERAGPHWLQRYPAYPGGPRV
jgi:hypothetical protein